MKKITFFIFLLITSIGYSQVVLEDFEGTPTLTGFEGLTAANIVANPSVDMDNGSATVGELIVVAASGQPWQGADMIFQGDNIDVTTPTTQTVSVDVYATQAFTLYAEVGNGVDGAVKAGADESHGGTGWETLTFTFNEAANSTGVANGVYGKMSFFPNWNGSGWHEPALARTIYIDNITGFAAAPPTPPTAPTTAAPDTPTFDANNVISIYSDSFTDVTSNFDANFCGTGSTSEVMIAGNPTINYLLNACQGIDFPGDRRDATAFNKVHIDFYVSPDVTDFVGKVFNLKLVDLGNAGGTTEVSNVQINLNDASSPAITAGSWISVDATVDLSTFTGLAQAVITSNLNGTVWYDNFYVYVDGTASTDDFNVVELSTYPNPSSTDWNIKASNSAITSVEVFNLLGKRVLTQKNNGTDVVVSTQGLTSGIYIARVTTDLGTKTIKLIKE